MNSIVVSFDPSGLVCIAGICGPDITIQLDLTLHRAVQEFYKRTKWERFWGCQMGAWWQWDITPLHQERVIAGECPSP